MKKGTANARPTRSQLVTVSYSLTQVENVTSKKTLIEEVKDVEFFVGENDILPSIDYTIQSMDEGEIALILSDVRHCYGNRGCEEKNLRPFDPTNPYQMEIHLEFHQYLPSPSVEHLSAQQRIFWA